MTLRVVGLASPLSETEQPEGLSLIGFCKEQKIGGHYRCPLRPIVGRYFKTRLSLYNELSLIKCQEVFQWDLNPQTQRLFRFISLIASFRRES